jgi:hypothetical protein
MGDINPEVTHYEDWNELLDNLKISIRFTMPLSQWEHLADGINGAFLKNCRSYSHGTITPFLEAILAETKKVREKINKARDDGR